ncbi:lipid II flippase MurJ [Enterococcus mundtii]|uniref:lipid II flippase MurJ n=1 Tax=Enterococcus mundtii TaxID=53346 RepID=UPI0018984CAC|nr:lipid II flippase MurJ [Enterococcus mundtii]MDB7100871.1 lipid II flippase MurJ [Enterococcus mundtii]
MNKVLKSFPAILSLTFLIQLFGLLRSIFLSKNLGASTELDAFYLANILTISIFSIITSAISTVLIPNMISEKEKNKGSINYLSIIMGIALVFSLFFLLFLFLFIDRINPNFNDETQKNFFIMFILLLVSQFFRIISTYFMSKLQIHGKYFMSRFPNILPAFLPLIYIFFSNNFNMIVFVFLLALSYLLESQMYFLLGKFKLKKFMFKDFFSIQKKDSSSRKMLKNTLPILAGSTIFQLQIIITNYLAGYFGDGYITLLSNTNQIVGIFQGLLVANIFTLVYPHMVKLIKENIMNGLKQVETYILITNFIVIILVWGYIAIGLDLVKVLFYRGNFTLENSNTVYNFGLVLMLSLPFAVIRDYFYRIYYAIDNTSKPTKNSIITVIWNICLLFILKIFIQEYSLVVSTAIGTIFSLTNISIQMKNDNLLLNWKRLFKGFLFTNMIASLMFVGIRLFGINSKNSLNNILINIPIGILIVLISLLIIFVLFRKKINIKEIF